MSAMKSLALSSVLLLLAASAAEGQQVHLRVERRETVLGGRPFGLAGPYEKLVGTVEFAIDPKLAANSMVVDLPLAPRNAHGDVEFSADFYLLKPVEVTKGNGCLFYEVGNRGTKAMLGAFQKADDSMDPTTEAQFGDRSLMEEGFTLLWMGWQWDVPDGRMRMEMPIATENGQTITGLVRANFIPVRRTGPEPLGDRGHKIYLVLDPATPENVMTVRTNRTDPPQVVPRDRWRFADRTNVTLDGGFEPGRIYDVVYRSKDPRVVGVGLAGTRDLVSFFKYEKGADNPIPTIRDALAWGVSQSGRFLRHFIYQGFNADVRGRRVFDGVLDDKGGAGRGSFNHRFAQASRDALEHYNILYPVDMFPFADGTQTDPETGQTDGLLARAEQSGTAPKIFHILSNSEYFNRAGSLIHTDVRGERDAELPPNTRIYLVSGTPHYSGSQLLKGDGTLVGQAALSPLDDRPVVRALLHAMDRWVTEDVAPPPSAYPTIADGTLVPRENGGWPAIPGYRFPPPQLIAYRLDFGPNWLRGIVDNEPPKIGSPYVVRAPAVDADGNDRAGVCLPQLAAPLATYAGWNYRDASIGAPEHLAGEIGSYFPFARTRSKREGSGDPRASIEERYPNKEAYLGKITAAADDLVTRSYLLARDVPDVISDASEEWGWATSSWTPLLIGVIAAAARWRWVVLLILFLVAAGVLRIMFLVAAAALRRWRASRRPASPIRHAAP
jgi:hypothetical protein